MTGRWRSWLWVALLVAATTVPLFVSDTAVEATSVGRAVQIEEVHVAECAEDGTCDANGSDDFADDEVQDEDEDMGDFGDDEDDDEDDDEPKHCEDRNDSCDSWASLGECEKNPSYMLSYCQKSCWVCGFDIDMGIEQTVDPEFEDAIHRRLERAEDYLRNEVAKDYKGRLLLEICKNKKKECAKWAVQGECEANPGYMQTKCAPVCFSCDQLSMSARCPIDLDKMPNAWKPGDLNKFFMNLTTHEEYVKYEPKVLSSPSYLPGDTEETADYLIGGPWVVVLDNVLSEEEAERMIELGTIEGYEGSYAGGKLKADGTYERGYSDIRTSENAWCQNECYEDPVAQRVIERITNITNVDEKNSEYLQLLRYEPGQFYKAHHDYLEHNVDRQCGVRIITVFLYLCAVEEGGGTNFPDYNITVMPKRGRALIWPNVKDEAPDEQDDRTEHQALPVIRGVKYGANAWIHQRDFKTPFHNQCN